MFTKEFLFPGSGNSSLSARIYSSNTKNNKGVLFSHGLFSSKDGYKITHLADGIVSCGYDLMTFNFSSSENPGHDVRKISVTGQVQELSAAVNEFQRRGISKIHIMGSSMGAAVTLLYAASAEAAVESLILIATPLDLLSIIPGMTAEKALQLDDSAFSEISGIKVSNIFFREIAHISMLDAVRKIKSPVLLIHGKKDPIVDFSNFGLFISNCATQCRELAIEGGDHNLTGDREMTVILENTVTWLERFNA